ncbi:MAG TPA: hypothetical protein VMT87_15235 [Vicinamibacteria bacterium]|nr:hypothetical protein [Vicinamibacteria bacterium]
MKTRSALRVLLAAGACCLAAAVGAQPPEEKPAEKQEKTDAPPRAKSYTDDDLKKYTEERAANPESESSPGDAAAPADEPNADEPGEPPAEGEGRQFWADRAKAQRERIAAAEESIVATEEKIAGLRNDRDPTRAMDPFRLQTIEAETRKAAGELEAAKEELAEARAALEAVLQDARKRGVPNGWLREP